MKRIALSVDDALYERSRVVAAERRTTLAGLVRDFLRGLPDPEERRARARREIAAMVGHCGGRVGRMPSREERNAR